MQQNIGHLSMKIMRQVTSTICWWYQIAMIDIYIEREGGQSSFCEMTAMVTNSVTEPFRLFCGSL